MWLDDDCEGLGRRCKRGAARRAAASSADLPAGNLEALNQFAALAGSVLEGADHTEAAGPNDGRTLLTGYAGPDDEFGRNRIWRARARRAG